MQLEKSATNVQLGNHMYNWEKSQLNPMYNWEEFKLHSMCNAHDPRVTRKISVERQVYLKILVITYSPLEKYELQLMRLEKSELQPMCN